MLIRILLGTMALALAMGAASAAETGPKSAGPAKPAFINGEVLVKNYPSGGTNDLLTGGLGANGLAGAAPSVSNPPTAEELRTLAIYSNYRALVDVTSGGGYGRLYGPTIPPTNADAAGKVYGVEYLAYARGRGGDQNITMAVQIPEAFPGQKPCLVTAPSSGSRGVYGAIGTAGEWGLKRGCAVAYTDKGTGTGAHNLERDTVSRITGERVDADAAGDQSNFTADLNDAERLAYNASYPNRWAYKHAHSERNPEADWDDHVVLSLRFALWAINHKLSVEQGAGAPELGWDDLVVIGSSVSNGGGASLRAAEIAPKGIIDGVVVAEPNVNPRHDSRFVIRQGNDKPLRAHSRPLYDYLTLIDLYQGCANLTPANATAPFNITPPVTGGNRCTALAKAGLLSATTQAAQAEEAQAIINSYGILEEANVVAPSYWASYVVQAVTVSYAPAYGRASVTDNVCGYSFAVTGTDEKPAPLPATAEASLFATSNGIPPTSGINVVNNLSVGGPVRDQVSVSPSSKLQDQNLDGALCLRSLETGKLLGKPLGGAQRVLYQRVQEGISQILASGKLGGIPTIVLHGRSDALLAPNHTSRPYYALSLLKDGGKSRIAYIEVTNAQHLDAFNGLVPGYNERFIPLHYYFIKAMDQMYAHLTQKAALPKSQVVHTKPRGKLGDGTVPPLDEANLPPIVKNPKKADRIVFNGKELYIPD